MKHRTLFTLIIIGLLLVLSCVKANARHSRFFTQDELQDKPPNLTLNYQKPVHISTLTSLVTDTKPLANIPELELKEIKPVEFKSTSPQISVSGNTYPDSSQCVWWVFQRRLDTGRPIPHWGSAYKWMSAAQSQGWETGATPRDGAIGWIYGHVVFVERVNADGTVYVSERNFDYRGSTRYVTVLANTYRWIY